MRIYISADLEGISGVVATDQTSNKGSDYDRARKLMTGEVNAAAEAAFEVGAEEVVVNDGHGSMRNILIDEVMSDVKLMTGSPKILGQMEGIDRSPGFDACLFVGYHARAGTHGVLNHTISGAVVSEVQINGQSLGETGINAALAGQYDIPLVFVSGDTDVCAQAESIVENIVTVPVKEAAGRYAALCNSPDKAREMIQSGVKEALREFGDDKIKPFETSGPVKVKLATFDTAMADLAALLPGSQREDELSVFYECDDVKSAYKALRAMIYLASSSRG